MVSIVSLLTVGGGATFATRSVARHQALEDSERMTQRLSGLVVAPLVPAYLQGSRAAAERLDAAIRSRLDDGALLDVTLWNSSGLIVYSSVPAEIGRVVPPPEEVGEAVRGRSVSGFESGEPEAAEATAPEGSRLPTTSPRLIPRHERFVEVYVPLYTGGQTLVFEAYYDYENVDRVAHRLRGQTLPLVLAPLVLLQLVQLPVALSLARRLKRRELEYARALEDTLNASDHERTRLAADLHDGPLQELAGVGYVLGAVSPAARDQDDALLTRARGALQRAVESLRMLMSGLYTVGVEGSLEQSLEDLGEPLRRAGVDVSVQLGDLTSLPDDVEVTVYRVARESLLNVAKHAHASTVSLSVQLLDGSRGGWLRIAVADDGMGMDTSMLGRRIDGHLGLTLVSDRVASVGGGLIVTSGPGRGTRVVVDLPLVRPAP